MQQWKIAEKSSKSDTISIYQQTPEQKNPDLNHTRQPQTPQASFLLIQHDAAQTQSTPMYSR
jgi:hypothetical protein